MECNGTLIRVYPENRKFLGLKIRLLAYGKVRKVIDLLSGTLPGLI